MSTPYVSELVRRMRLDSTTVRLDVTKDGAATIVWRHPDVDHPLVLLVRKIDLAAAVVDLGTGWQNHLWPRSSIDAAGFNLLLVHLDEVLATRDTTEPLRIRNEGLQWPQNLLSERPST